MLEPRVSARRLAQAVARAQTALAGDERGPLVAQLILMRLHERLGKLIGPAGVDRLLARALVLVRRAHPAFAGITVGPGGKLEGLANLPRAGTGVHQGALAIVSHFIEILMNLIGEDLTVRVIRDLWPPTPGEEER